ncbi:MAG TPA: hypothetical protein VHM01_10630, partial [Alphaproteobacteria bacterium]|nr:hypothetical protein [Alphaproteobacteria bacterium]
DMSKPVMGFGQSTRREGEDTEAIKRLFTPEFRNRLDAVIPFQGLGPEIIASVVDKFVRELAARSESTSIRQAAVAIAAVGRVRRDAARELEFLAEAAARHLTVRAEGAKKDEVSAVAIVRMLAWNIRAETATPRITSRKSIAAPALRLA